MKPDGETAAKLGEVLAGMDRQSAKLAPKPTDPYQAEPERLVATNPPFLPISLKRSIDASASVDLDDSANVKRALAKLGLLKLPDGTIDAFPDRQMFDGVKAYQRMKGLRVDGVMKPDGETVAAMNEDLAKEAGRTGPTPDPETAFLPAAVPFAVWLMPILGAATAAAAMASYNQLNRSRQKELRKAYEKDRENDDICYHRWQTERSRCNRRAPMWKGGCKDRAADRYRLCVDNGGTPNPDEPPEWSKADEEVSFNPDR